MISLKNGQIFMKNLPNVTNKNLSVNMWRILDT